MYFRLLTDTKFLLAEAIISRHGLAKLRRLGESPEVEEIDDESAVENFHYYFVTQQEIDSTDDRCGERNVFYDHNGNEWHN